MTTPALAHGVAHSGGPTSTASLRWVAIAVAAALAATGSVVLAHASDHLSEPIVHAVLLNWTTLPYIAAGAIAWARRPESRFGPLMVAAGFAMFLSSLQWSSTSIPFTVGMVFDLLPAAIFLHVFLAFPDGRLERGLDRTVVLAAYGAALGLQLVKMLLWSVDGQNGIALANDQATAFTVEDIELFGLSALSLIGAAALLIRRRGLVRPLRPSVALLVDSFALGLVGVAILLIAGALEWTQLETIRRVTFGVVGIAPLAFLVGLLSARLSRSTLGDLLVQLKEEPAPADLRDSLADALRDPSLTVAYWLPAFGSWVDSKGHPTELPTEDSSRSAKLIEREGAPVAALVHDPSLAEEPELLDAVSAAAGIALENERLHAELRARLDELRGSRQRVIEAGQEERQRLERDLHDGAQQRLVALSLQLKLLGRAVDDPAARRQLEDAQQEVSRSLDELRDLARGIHPAVLTAHGLSVALEQVVAHAPFPVAVDVSLDARLAEPVEVAAYFVVTESLANAAKHARATRAAVAIRRAGSTLIVEVSDDGVGGANTDGGSGIRGLADRVEALGGRLRVWSEPGHGTRVLAELPCA
jgi:signal transduction histidine kinase